MNIARARGLLEALLVYPDPGVQRLAQAVVDALEPETDAVLEEANRNLAILFRARARCGSQVMFDSLILGEGWHYMKPTYLIDWSKTAFWDQWDGSKEDEVAYSIMEGM